jgi:hypothetical protein
MNLEMNKNGGHSGMISQAREKEGRKGKKLEERKGRKGD